MHPLKLPSCELRIQEIDGKNHVFDILRKKFILLTPEEWVRQHFIHLLIFRYKYPRSLIKTESGLKYNKMKNRCDIVVFDRSGNTFLIVECKSADVPISQKIFEQVARYNFVLKAKYIVVTNGLNVSCCEINHELGTYHFLPELPSL